MIHWKVCIPPIEIPITARQCERCSTWVTNWCSELTMSRMETRGNFMCGCDLLLEGEDDTPSANASTVMRKNFAESMSFPGPISPARFSVLPVNQVGQSTAFDLASLRWPNVR